MQRRTASSAASASISSENLISEVEIARMLMLRSASALNALAATPAWLRMPMPITETLATSLAPSSRSKPIAAFGLFQHLAGALESRPPAP